MDINAIKNGVVKPAANAAMVNDIIKRMAKRYSDVANIYMYGLDLKENQICEMTGDDIENAKLAELVTAECIEDMFHRVTDSPIERQAYEETSYPNIYISGISVSVEKKHIITWIIIGVLNDSDIVSLPGSIALNEVSRTTSKAQYMEAVDVVRDLSDLLAKTQYTIQNAEAESARHKFTEEETKNSLKRIEAISSIVQLLDSNESIEIIMNELIRVIGEYLDISNIFISKSKVGSDFMDIVSEWKNKGAIMPFDKTKDVYKLNIFNIDKAVVVSSDTRISDADRETMADLGISAYCVMPFFLPGSNAVLQTCFFDCTPDKKWTTSDIKFMHDSVKVLQSIVTKRIHKNSLASSYASLEAILDNVGSGIYVRDMETKAVLFANRIMKNTFATEFKNGTIDGILESAMPINPAAGVYEIHYIERGRWYDLHYTYINWVDGRMVSLCSVYDVTDKKNYQRKIEQQAYTDFLTGLYNRMCCERDLATNIDEAKRTGTQGAVLYLDLDDFKHINDGLGHQYGDALLKAISNAFQRVEGIENTCYRMGGDEFVIIIPPSEHNNEDRIIKDVKDIFSRPWYLKDADYYSTMSMGIVEFPKNGESVPDLIKKADIAMYEAKKSGKNRAAFYSDTIVTSSNERLDMEKNLRDATNDECDEFEVYYQPIIDITKGNACVGAEALVRWNSLELGFVSPGDFIPLAEYLGLINPIGNHVLRKACETCRFWNEMGRPNYRVNVNLSVVQLLQSDIVDAIEEIIEGTGINPANLTLEVTESLAINDMERMKKILSGIKALGVRIALDDFGTGYSSLNHIREIPFDVIKVDQTFVRDLSEDAYSQSFIKMVAELAQTIGVSICVEGIESEKQFSVLRDMKVRTVQGFYFDRPMPRADFEAKYVLNYQND